MNLKHLTDSVLLADTKFLVNRERELTTKILHHLKEIDKRKLYSDLKYSSLYEYCIRELGYSEASAHRRIVAARMLETIPEIEEKIDQGLLNLTNIAQANQFFKENGVTDPVEKKEILDQLEGKSKKETEKKLDELSGNKPERKVIIHLEMKTIEAIEKVRSLVNTQMNMNEVIKYMADFAHLEIEKRKFKLASKQILSPPPAEVNRVISNQVKRAVYIRDNKKCTKCGSTYRLNFDHIIPFALGGDSSEENVRLLCFNCNQRARITSQLHA